MNVNASQTSSPERSPLFFLDRSAGIMSKLWHVESARASKTIIGITRINLCFVRFA